jgi:sugar phosphate isomerase/epimerase
MTDGPTAPGPRFSVIEFSTPTLSFAEDVAAYRAAGADGIGICEAKLGDDATDLELLRRSGLVAASAFPMSPSILPARLLPGPDDPAGCIAGLRRSIERLSSFGPRCIFFASGPLGAYEPERAREIVVEGLRELAPVAADLGIVLGVETMPPSLAAEFSWIHTISEMRDLLHDAGEPNARIAVDIWHLAEIEEPLANLRDAAADIVSLHICDRRDPTRTWQDRLFPGDGVADVPGILGALDEGGFSGWFEMEVLSDTEFPDSLWKLDPVDFVATCRAKFERAWTDRRHGSPDGATARREEARA